jgi:polyferredoxin
MSRIGRPTGLIGYDTEMNLQRRIAHEEPITRIVRPRTILYTALIVLVAALMTWTFAARKTLGLSVLHDRNPLYVRLADGAVRNGFTVRLSNKALEERPFRIELIGLPDAQMEVVGTPRTAEQSALLSVEPDQTRELRVLVTLPKGEDLSTRGIRFRLTDVATGATSIVDDTFQGPRSAP